MAKLLNKVLNFVGWESEEEAEFIENYDELKEEIYQPQSYQNGTKKRSSGKVVNIHSASQLKVVVMQPENLDDAQEICDHLKNKKPVVVNLETVGKEEAQRVIDFLSGSIYALDGCIQKVSSGIFIIAPNNVDIMGDFKDELRKGIFPWTK